MARSSSSSSFGGVSGQRLRPTECANRLSAGTSGRGGGALNDSCAVAVAGAGCGGIGRTGGGGGEALTDKKQRAALLADQKRAHAAAMAQKQRAHELGLAQAEAEHETKMVALRAEHARVSRAAQVRAPVACHGHRWRRQWPRRH